MSVTWTDTPGSVVAPGDALDFVATGEVMALSVRYGLTRPEERAYRDGAFVFPFLGSTKVGTTFSLRRTGGWPLPPTVFVDEDTPIPTGGQALGAIYEVDLTAQATQTMSAAGSYVIDGKTWWAKSTLASGQSCALTNGMGLTIQYAGTGATAYSPTGNMAYRMLFFPLAQLSGFNPLAPTTVLFRFAGTNYTSVSYILGGLVHAVDSAAAWASADRPAQMWCGFGAGAASTARYASGGSSVSGVTITPTSLVAGDHAFGVCNMMARYGVSMHGAWSGSLPSDPRGLTSGVIGLPTTLSPTNIGFGMAVNTQVNQLFQPYLTHLRVMQPRLTP
jgi:hypothetical protein